MDPVLPLLAPDQQRYPRQRQTGGGIHRPDNGDPTHGITVIKCGVYLLVLGLTYGRAHYKCDRFIENYAIVICIRIPAFCKKSRLLSTKSWVGRTESDARPRAEDYVLFRGTG